MTADEIEKLMELMSKHNIVELQAEGVTLKRIPIAPRPQADGERKQRTPVDEMIENDPRFKKFLDGEGV